MYLDLQDKKNTFEYPFFRQFKETPYLHFDLQEIIEIVKKDEF